MKKKIITIFIAIAIKGMGQTAVNFNTSDCTGTNHDLFSELNSGKVIVMTWVMPCSACTGVAGTSANTVASYTSSNPDRVKFYLIDDYGNTGCSSLSSWAISNGFHPDATFSDSAISMGDYGTAGMQKTIVLSGRDHSVFYNVVGAVNAGDIENAINNALAAPSGISENYFRNFQLSIFPNPINKSITTLSFNLTQSGNIILGFYNAFGTKVKEIALENQSVGKHLEIIDLHSLSKGNYFIKLMEGQSSQTFKFTLAN